MADLGPFYPNTYSAQPPGMLPKDAPVWARFVEQHGASFQGYWFNVRVGTASALPADASDADRATWAALTRKRIDAIALRPDEIWLIEVNQEPSPTAIGQLAIYTQLLAEETDDPRPIRPVLVAERVDEDQARVMRAQGVTVVLV